MPKSEKIRELLSSPKKIILTIHLNPDADALGSALAFASVLKIKGHTVTIISPNSFPLFLKWMKGSDQVLLYDKQKQECDRVLKSAEVIFSIDYSTLNRIGPLKEEIEKSKATKVIIDHHRQPEKYADLMKWNTEAAATAELIFDLIKELNWIDLLDKNSGECLYAGIMTDTGGFRHPNTTQHIHEIVAQLIGINVDGYKVSKLIYDSNSVDRIKLLGFALSQRLVVINEFNVSYIYLSEKDLTAYNAQKGDTEGLVNYALSIKGVTMATLFTEKDNMIKMSFRSIGSFSVNNFAKTHFNGGGHTNSAGGIDKIMNLKEVIEKYKKILPNYKLELNKQLCLN